MLPSGELRHFACREAHRNKSAGKKGRIPERGCQTVLYPLYSLLCLVPLHVVTARAWQSLCFRYLDNTGLSPILISEKTVWAFFSRLRHILTQNLHCREKFFTLQLLRMSDSCICPTKGILVWSHRLEQRELTGQSLCSAGTPPSETCTQHSFP